jgi:dolichol-phosphate mannosyltransferase
VKADTLGVPSGRRAPLLSVVIPAHNEAGSIRNTVKAIAAVLERESIEFEIVVVDDASTDDTAMVTRSLAVEDPRIMYYRSHNPPGFGFAVRAGLDVFAGDLVAIVMADGSDDPDDLVRYYAVLQEGYDCAFGSRFIRGSAVSDYPKVKLAVNRFVNWGIRFVFRSGYNDTTNAFKAYRREVIDTVQPLLSNHFNLTVEIPLKAIVRGHTYKVVPISWRNRNEGESKLSLQEMGSRYAFIVMYVLLERHLSRGDYRRAGTSESQPRGFRKRALKR